VRHQRGPTGLMGCPKPLLEYWRVDGLGHARSRGRTSGSYMDPNGPEATQIVTSFFRQHRLPYSTNGPDGRAFEEVLG